jgi:hypothetical protein
MADNVVYGQYQQVYVGQSLKFGAAAVQVVAHAAVNNLVIQAAQVAMQEEQSQ